MADWQQYVQSIFIGLIFSFLLAKLFSVIFSFRDENLRITRAVEEEDESSNPLLTGDNDDSGISAAAEIPRVSSSEKESLAKDNAASVVSSSGSDSDDDWEGVESTELDEVFSAATAFVAATAADKTSQKVSSDLQLQLYGLYKIAIEGPCSVPQPSAIKMTARAKWQAWQKLGAMPPEEAMEKYIDIVTALYPSWLDGSVAAQKKRGGNSGNEPSTDTRPMGPVFSSLIYEEESGEELNLDAIHAFAREGDVENLRKCVDSGVPVDLKDSEGRTPLHWAVDRGHLDITELLLSKNADVDAKDNEGQTPLHYAAVCDREAIAEFLVKQNAATDVKDEDGNLPRDLCDSEWPWMQPQLAGN